MMKNWLYILTGAAIYIGCGFWLAGNGTVEEWMYRIGLTGSAVIPIVFVAIYTVLGWTGRAKWWRNPIGSALVQAALSLVPIAGPLAWVFWVDNGLLHTSWLAWIEVSGPVVSALAWARLCAIWVAVRAREKKLNGTS